MDLAKRAVNVYVEETKNIDVQNSKPLIAGSVGSYGASLHDCSEYSGSYGKSVTHDAMFEWHRPRIQALVDAGVDLLAVETIPSAIEAEAVVDLLREFPDTKAWLSFSCQKDGRSLADGNDFKEVALRCYKKAKPGQLLAIGVNCLAPRFVTPLLASISEKETKEFIPMVAYPNSGETFTDKNEWHMDGDFHPPEEFIEEWLDLGVRYIGTCCRTSTKDIERIGELLKKWHRKQAEKASRHS